MSNTDNALRPLRRFRIVAVRLSLILTALLAGGFYTWDPIAAQGALLGGIAGILGFWIIAIRLEKLANKTPSKVQFAALTWSAYRFALYGAVLYRSYTLDRVEWHGLIGALVGIMMIRFVLVFLGVTGFDTAASTSGNDPGTDEHTETQKSDLDRHDDGDN
jgi:ATP synthase I chain